MDKEPGVVIQICKKSLVKFTKDEHELRHKLDTSLENSGYDHNMSLQHFENMLDDIILTIRAFNLERKKVLSEDEFKVMETKLVGDTKCVTKKE